MRYLKWHSAESNTRGYNQGDKRIYFCSALRIEHFKPKNVFGILLHANQHIIVLWYFFCASFTVMNRPLTFKFVCQRSFSYLPTIQPHVLWCQNDKNIMCLWEIEPIGEVHEITIVALHFHIISVERVMPGRIDLKNVSVYHRVNFWLVSCYWDDDGVVKTEEDDWSCYFVVSLK